jgi:hypothetical protein
MNRALAEECCTANGVYPGNAGIVVVTAVEMVALTVAV